MNCSAAKRALLPARLSKQIGRFELADASTIFLDEIDALPLELQAKLLRVLESAEFERLGSPVTVKVDVRIISATNRDLGQVGQRGRVPGRPLLPFERFSDYRAASS